MNLEGLDALQLGLAVVVNQRSTADVVIEIRLLKKLQAKEDQLGVSNDPVQLVVPLNFEYRTLRSERRTKRAY